MSDEALVLRDAEAEVVGVGDIDEIVNGLAGVGVARFHEPGVLHPSSLSTDR